VSRATDGVSELIPNTDSKTPMTCPAQCDGNQPPFLGKPIDMIIIIIIIKTTTHTREK
jgi:hypothetical protein